VLLADGAVDFDALVGSAELAWSLSLWQAWTAVVGMPPTRADLAAIRRDCDQEGAFPARAFWGRVLQATPFGLVHGAPAWEALQQTAQRSHADAVARLTAPGRRAVLPALLSKLADRICGPQEGGGAMEELRWAAWSGDGAAAVREWVRMCCRASNLADFEQASQPGSPPPPGRGPPGSPVEFYARSRAACVRLALLAPEPTEEGWDQGGDGDEGREPLLPAPLSHPHLAAAEPQPPSLLLFERTPPAARLTCNEALRLALCRDGRGWRALWGTSRRVRAEGHGLLGHPLQSGLPARALLHGLPAGMFARLAVDGCCRGAARSPALVAVPARTDRPAPEEVEAGADIPPWSQVLARPWVPEHWAITEGVGRTFYRELCDAMWPGLLSCAPPARAASYLHHQWVARYCCLRRLGWVYTPENHLGAQAAPAAQAFSSRFARRAKEKAAPLTLAAQAAPLTPAAQAAPITPAAQAAPLTLPPAAQAFSSRFARRAKEKAAPLTPPPITLAAQAAPLTPPPQAAPPPTPLRPESPPPGIEGRGLGGLGFGGLGGLAPPLNSVVVVDSRCNVFSLASVLVALDNLGPAWRVQAFCSAAGAAYTERLLRPLLRCGGVPLEVLALPELEEAPFGIDQYNALLKSEAFWHRVRGERCLLVQDDGLLVRPGLEASGLLDYDYVGAPWVAAAQEELTRLAGGTVGNGGLSVRNPALMARLCRSREAEGRRLFFLRNLLPLPEDVFFAGGISAHSRCPEEEARRFSCEQWMPSTGADGYRPLGWHKPWAYHAPERAAALMGAALPQAEA
jgi:hypothetical protein